MRSILRPLVLACALAGVAAGPACDCTGPVGADGDDDDDDDDGGEGEGEGGEGEAGEGEGEGGEGEGEPGLLAEGTVCSPNRWCFETPLPGGGTLTGVAATGPNAVVAASSTHLYHVEGAPTPASSDGVRIRHAAPPTLTPYLNAMPVWAAAPDDVWAFGFTSLIHFDGARWSLFPSAQGFASSINGTASDDVFAVGFSQASHFDGIVWRPLDLTPFEDAGAQDVWAFAPGAAVIAGSAPNTAPGAPNSNKAIVLLVEVGADGVVTNLTDLGYPDTDFTSQAVFATAPDDVWAGGGNSLRRLVDGAWTVVATGNGGAILDIWGSGPDDVWFTTATAVRHWDGASVETFTIEGQQQLLFVSGTPSATGGPSRDVWVSDFSGALHHWDGAAWSSLKRPITNQAFTDVAAAGTGADAEVWAQGFGALAARKADGTWAPATPPTAQITGIAAAGDTIHAFAAGGAFRRTVGDAPDAWQLTLGGAGLADACATSDGVTHAVATPTSSGGVSSAPPAKLLDGDEWVDDPSWNDAVDDVNRLFCVGAEVWGTSRPGVSSNDVTGTLVHHDGTSWQRVGLASLGQQARARASFVPAVDDAWVLADTEAGTAAGLMRFDGAEWREVLLEGVDAADVLGLGGSGADDVWIVGAQGLVRVVTAAGVVARDLPEPVDIAWVHVEGAEATAVSLGGAVWRFSGGDWTEVVAPFTDISAISSDALVDVAFANGVVYAAGDRDEALFVEPDAVDAAWGRPDGFFSASRVDASDEAGVWFVDFIGRVARLEGNATVDVDPSFSDAADVLVIGDSVRVSTDFGSTRLLRFDGSAFVIEESFDDVDGLGELRFATFFGGAVIGGANAGEEVLWVVGGDDIIDEKHVVLRRVAGGDFDRIDELVHPVAVQRLSSNGVDELIAVDARLGVWRREDGRWRNIIPAREGFSSFGAAAHVNALTDIWAVALNGILHFDGAAWTNLAEPVGLGFQTMTTAPDGTLFAGGAPGTIVSRRP